MTLRAHPALVPGDHVFVVEPGLPPRRVAVEADHGDGTVTVHTLGVLSRSRVSLAHVRASDFYVTDEPD